MAGRTANDERRKSKRVSVDFPVAYELQGKEFLGNAFNACNEGMMVESYCGLEPAVRILRTLTDKEGDKVALEFTSNGRSYQAEGEIKHFHLHFVGREPFRVEMGFFLPKIH